MHGSARGPRKQARKPAATRKTSPPGPRRPEAPAAAQTPILQPLGVRELDERVYRALLRHPGASIAELARRSRATTGQVRPALTRLTEAGLVVATDKGGYLPADPEVAVRALVARRQADLDATRFGCDQLVAEFHAGHLADHPAHLIELLADPTAIDRRVRDLLRQATDEIMVCEHPDVASPGAAEAAAQPQELRKRGVRLRALYTTQTAQTPGRFPALNALTESGHEVRIADRVPEPFLIADRTTAIIPFTEERRPGSVAVIQPSGILTALVGLFETAWTHAHPLGTSPDQQVTLPNEDALVLKMLDAGFADEMIANQLQVSTRTVGRRIQRVLNTLDVSTRFQAGRQAHRQGWVP